MIQVKNCDSSNLQPIAYLEIVKVVSQVSMALSLGYITWKVRAISKWFDRFEDYDNNNKINNSAPTRPKSVKDHDMSELANFPSLVSQTRVYPSEG
jgi:hypothetical protein